MDIIDTVKSVLPYVGVLILSIFGGIISFYLKPYFDAFFKNRREKRLEKDKKAKKAFEKKVEYYLRQPDGRIVAYLYIISIRQYQIQFFITGMIAFSVIMVTSFLGYTELVYLLMLIFGYCATIYYYYEIKISHQKQVFYEIDKRLLKKESQKPPKSSQ